MIKVFSSLQLYVCMFIHAKKCLPRYVHMSYYYCPNKVQGEAKLKIYLGLTTNDEFGLQVRLVSDGSNSGHKQSTGFNVVLNLLF